MTVLSIRLNGQVVVGLRIDKRVWGPGLEGARLTRGQCLPSFGFEAAGQRQLGSQDEC